MKKEFLHSDELMNKYIVKRNLPTIWCPGCGIGTTLASMARAIERLELDKRDVLLSVGIGCSGFSSRYLNFDVVHTTHGRAIAVATGMKIAKPQKHVIVLTGDGDCLAIGGNHFIHACRRNINLTVLLFNNSIYGMTGGQYSPTTPMGSVSRTSPLGLVENDFDACRLAIASGASYVARSTTYHVNQLTDLIGKAIAHPGLSVVEAVSQCPSQYGSINRLGTGAEMMRQYAADFGPHKQGRFVTGVLHHEVRPEYTEEYDKVRRTAQSGLHHT